MVPGIYSIFSLGCSFVITTVTNDTYAQYVMDESCFGSIITGIAFTFLATGILVLISYGIILVKLLNSHNLASSNSEHIERKITIVAALISGLLVFNCFLMFKLCPPEKDHEHPIGGMIRNATEMLFSMCNPYLFFATSAPVRDKFILVRFCGFRWIQARVIGSSSGQAVHPEQKEEIELR